ncbi:MAG: F0F1 ATP synthase subunit B [Candidatus Latescibacterota bacterium]|jgi:F-type H+-transporting ATPase subunit b
MHLEWSVIITQAVGFIVVLLILKKFAWGKLLGFIDQRREKIESEFSSIERGREEVDSLKGDLEQQLANIEETRRQKIQEAAQEAGKLAGEIKDEARQDVMSLRAKAEQDIQMELNKANVQLRDQMVDAVITTTEKLIKERLDSEQQRKLISDFLADVSVGGGK